MRRIITIALLTTFTWTATLHAAAAAPIDWPRASASDAERAQHCAAVLTAFGLAYLYAAELMELDDVPRPAMLPEHILEAAGGPESYDTIFALVDLWQENWQSVGRTNFYPRLAGAGTPYIADDGQILMQAVRQCMQHYDL